ncbi:nucleoside-diphosphate sugar epimerase/dehydratase [Psychrobacter piechaudii]|uniref:UDP-N-acetyl-alpha-D-glucosamine C6 dehydratase n=1 Tax=Psychrobacter piechaudii TaxID=1945521 RepID=A0A1R4GPI4_9GAMM|nr:nucleoside-diphosphate sugar epimerase/dehydratase [Psychrobacter piechaudii]SJM70024.1 UDP-N-acetyl-alpha-D-glucosamine C6 dehydratase [Psychrobacter piechaudii]
MQHKDKDSRTKQESDFSTIHDDPVPTKLSTLAEGLLQLPRPVKQAILLLGDYCISIVCLFFALSLRQGVLDVNASPLLVSLYALVPILGLYVVGFYRGVTRIFFDTDMRRVLKLFVIILIIFTVVYLFDFITSIPRSVPLLYLFMLFIWLWGSRLFLRDLLLRLQGKPVYQDSKNINVERDNVLIYGAGVSGTALFDALEDSPRYQVKAFIDDDTRLTGGHILNKRIYPATDIKHLIDDLNIAQVFLAMPSVSRQRRREIIDGLTEMSVKIKQLPSLQDIAEGKVTVSTMRRVDILDVLDRQTVEPDQALLHKNIKGKNVLVTGAGGSIGSELCRQIVKNKPKCIVLYELSEYALYAIHQELVIWTTNNSEGQNIEIIALLGNVNNQDKLSTVFKKYDINTVYHAAAYKHVPIVEFNPFEGVINNAKGTYHCVKAAIESEVETFVLISTDKAVRPTNIMGASKRLAELVCQGFSNANPKTKISMVRFGNVLGSSGSVVPLFTKQIAKGGPITVTHPEVTRYFMTIPEAANLVIQAGAMAQGGEVFVLDMGKPVKIVDLARRMIHLSGYEVKDESNPAGDIEIIFSGLRPGEKLYEELIIGDDNVEATQHSLIMQAREHSFDLDEIESVLFELKPRAQQHDVDWLKNEFSHYVEGYKAK